MANHSSILSWKIPWSEEPDRLQSLGGRKESDTTKQFHFHFLFMVAQDDWYGFIEVCMLHEFRQNVRFMKTFKSYCKSIVYVVFCNFKTTASMRIYKNTVEKSTFQSSVIFNSWLWKLWFIRYTFNHRPHSWNRTLKPLEFLTSMKWFWKDSKSPKDKVGVNGGSNHLIKGLELSGPLLCSSPPGRKGLEVESIDDSQWNNHSCLCNEALKRTVKGGVSESFQAGETELFFMPSGWAQTLQKHKCLHSGSHPLYLFSWFLICNIFCNNW